MCIQRLFALRARRADVVVAGKEAHALGFEPPSSLSYAYSHNNTTANATTPSMTPDPLLRVLERHVIYDTILDLCPITTVLRLKRDCRATNAAVTDYMGRLYDINRHLSHFFEDPKAFRAIQARTGALIVGP